MRSEASEIYISNENSENKQPDNTTQIKESRHENINRAGSRGRGAMSRKVSINI